MQTFRSAADVYAGPALAAYYLADDDSKFQMR